MLPKRFGQPPAGERLARIRTSRNYRDGSFQNLSPTPAFAEGYSLPGVLYNFLFRKVAQKTPPRPIPTIKTDLATLPLTDDVLVWFGHSSYYFQLSGKRFLVDPVFSGNASPISGTTKAFRGADAYGVHDMPPIDFLLLTHDHYDHLDYPTISLLREKTARVICGLGVGAHLERWAYSPDGITELDWHDRIPLDGHMTLTALPARHFSGRTFRRNTTLWLSFLLQVSDYTLFLGGDSGYDHHFKAIGEQFGPIDLALMDNGQYDPAWRYIHAHPDETLRAAGELRARRLMPVHSAKFALAQHAWDEPLKRISALNAEGPRIPLVTPMIGEPVYLRDTNQVFRPWWNDVT